MLPCSYCSYGFSSSHITKTKFLVSDALKYTLSVRTTKPSFKYPVDILFPSPEYSAYFIDKLNAIAGKEVFGHCYDTGHGHLVRKEPAENIGVIGDRLKVLHVHDNMGYTDDHFMPFAGNIDWNEFCEALKNSNYDGVISFETFRSTDRGYAFSEEMCLLLLETIGKIGKAFLDRIYQK